MHSLVRLCCLRISFFLALLFCVYATAGGLYAQEQQRLVRIGTFPLHPLNFFNDDQLADGLYPNIINEVAKQHGWQLEFIAGDWATCLKRLQSGEIDIMTTIAYSPERAKSMDYSSEAVCDIWGQAFIRPGSKISGIRDLNDSMVGIMHRDINGANFISLAKRLGLNCTFKEFPTHADIFTAIAKKEIEAGIAPQHFGLRHAEKYGLVPSTIQFAPFSVFFATKKGMNTDLLTNLDSALKFWKQDANSFYYQRLNFWMGGENIEKTILPVWLLAFAGFIIIVAVFLFFTNRVLNNRVRIRTALLQEQERAYRDLVESANCVILRLDPHGKIKYINRYGLHLFGYTKKEILGKHIIGTILAKEEKDGRDLVSMVDDAFNHPNDYIINENENITKDGKLLYMQWSNRASLDEAGNVTEMLSIGIDITTRRKLEHDLLQARKMEAVGTLAGGVAHDFNNMLGGIIGASDILRLNAKPDQIEYLDMINNAGEQAASLIKQMLAFARKGDLSLKPTRITPVINDAIALLKRSIDKKIEIITNYEDDTASIMANAAQIENIIINLGVNASHAMQNGGKISISTKSIQLTEEKIINAFELTAGDYILLEVNDDGIGIAPEDLDKIFEPFYTTKGHNQGTGLGLAAVYGIVKGHQGAIEVSSVIDKGSTFTIYLPASEQASDTLQKNNTQQQGSGCILIIDDEGILRDMAATLLQELGYQTFSAKDGKDGLDVYQKHKQKIDAVLLDMIMPEMDGRETFFALRAIHSTLPIVIATGYMDDSVLAQLNENGLNGSLAKPYRAQDLKDIFSKILPAPTNN